MDTSKPKYITSNKIRSFYVGFFVLLFVFFLQNKNQRKLLQYPTKSKTWTNSIASDTTWEYFAALESE